MLWLVMAALSALFLMIKGADYDTVFSGLPENKRDQCAESRAILQTYPLGEKE